jgi:hypothetical protein
MTTLYALLQQNPNHWRDLDEECVRMRQWGFNPQAQAELRAEVGRALGVDDAFMARVQRRHPYYPIHASIQFPTLAAYIDATRDSYIADVRAYQAEVAAAEAAERKRRRAELKAERAAAAPERAQPPRASKRARANPKMTTTTTTTTAAVPDAPVLDEYERIYELRRAMCAWSTDPVGGRTRMIKDIVREHSATDREIRRAYLRVHAGLRPKASEYQELDAYAAAWRDALVKELLAYRATADRLFGVIKDSICSEARFLRRNGGKAAKKHLKARAHRAWRRNAERMQRNWVRSI